MFGYAVVTEPYIVVVIYKFGAIKFNQFPINVANARTVHKLQGQSIKNLVVSTWNYTGNWVYVVLSR